MIATLLTFAFIAMGVFALACIALDCLHSLPAIRRLSRDLFQ